MSTRGTHTLLAALGLRARVSLRAGAAAFAERFCRGRVEGIPRG